MEGCLVVALPTAGWAALVIAAALFAHLPGLHLLRAATPRGWGALAAGAGVGLLAAGVAVAGPAWPWWAVATAPMGLVLAASAACLVRRDPDSGYREHRLVIEGHPAAAALCIPPAAGGVARPPVVLVHGGGNDRLFGLWHLVDVLTEHGHAVVTAHVAGHGRGGRDRFGLAEARQRLDAVVEAASAKASGLPPVVIGQSIGAALALDLVARARPVAGVAAVSAPADGLDVSSVAAVELLALLRPPIYRALRYGNTYEVLPAAGRFKRRAFPVRVGRDESYVAAFDRVVREMALPARLMAWRGATQVLLVHGGRDGVIPVAQLDLLAAALQGRAEVARFPRVSHMDPLFDRVVIERLVAWATLVQPR